MKQSVDMQKIHQVVLDIYKEVKNICEENNLRYYAISGTTIGAVFWKRIIPWDDDIDIAMPAEDYAKFVKLCAKGKLSKHRHFKEYIWFGGKVHDDRTMFTNVYYLDNPENYTGISIDIVPLIGVPDDEAEQKKFVKELSDFHRAGALFERYGILKGFKNKKELFEKRKYFLETFKLGETKKVVDFSDHRYILDAAGFINPIIMKFEDTTIPVSSNHEQDLKTQYVNFQKYPPKEVRMSMHQKLSVINLNKSYLKYAEDFGKTPDAIKKIIDIMHSFEGFCEDGIYYRDDMVRTAEAAYNRIFAENEQLKNELRRAQNTFLQKTKQKIMKLRSRP